MGSQTNKPRRSTAIALASGILVMTLAAPADAGQNSSEIRGERVPIIMPAPAPPPPPVRSKRSIRSKHSFEHLRLSGLSGAWADAVLSLLFALDACAPPSAGSEDDATRF